MYLLYTHIVTCLFQYHHRDPHLIGVLTSTHIDEGRSLYYGLIADGIHTHPSALRVAHRIFTKGTNHFIA
jgi:N-acetylglucosamine-6-phosphate deacetylase